MYDCRNLPPRSKAADIPFSGHGRGGVKLEYSEHFRIIAVCPEIRGVARPEPV